MCILGVTTILTLGVYNMYKLPMINIFSTSVMITRCQSELTAPMFSFLKLKVVHFPFVLLGSIIHLCMDFGHGAALIPVHEL